MTLDDYLQVGVAVPIGSLTFTADAIKAFAGRYDPQRFHMDEAEAEHSVFGRLCASGWHTAAGWMKCNVASPVGGPWAVPALSRKWAPLRDSPI